MCSTRARSGRQTRTAGRLRARLVAVERAVDLLQRRQELFAPGGKSTTVDPPTPLVVLQPNQLLKQLLAPGNQPLPFVDLRRRIGASCRCPDARKPNDCG